LLKNIGLKRAAEKRASAVQHPGINLKIVAALPSRPLPENLSEGVGLKNEGVAFADADSLEGREGVCEEGSAHSVSPRFRCDRKMVDVAAAAVGAAEDGPDEVSPGYGDAAQTRVAG
jgi:hypothetical protein